MPTVVPPGTPSAGDAMTVSSEVQDVLRRFGVPSRLITPLVANGGVVGSSSTTSSAVCSSTISSSTRHSVVRQSAERRLVPANESSASAASMSRSTSALQLPSRLSSAKRVDRAASRSSSVCPAAPGCSSGRAMSTSSSNTVWSERPDQRGRLREGCLLRRDSDAAFDSGSASGSSGDDSPTMTVTAATAMPREQVMNRANVRRFM